MKTEDPIAQQPAPLLTERMVLPEKPGALRGQAWLTIQTVHAQRLFHGRAATAEKPAIVGLVGFANRLRVVWRGARGDDPYADWWLIKVDDGIALVGDHIRNRQADLVMQLDEPGMMEVEVATSRRPCRVPLKFANPYAYRGAGLLAEFDKLACMALTARYVGLLGGHACEETISESASKLRALFMIPQSYRLLKIDREQVRNKVGRSHEARRLMGEIPGDVLSGERKAPLVPRTSAFPSGVARNVKLRSGEPVVGANSPDE
ncbi:MAG: TIGR03761 family integrating conjugative element protein [Candidatus Thiodiazotropha endolucinida]|nr:TIGR03761 family integrating conjugative element protein [Candidatus Thiodiazotropha taylori]MCW4349694.1 TIGR03761 family integrating conjugative element protein [Candidatus Thiodiazotropha endolucinida]